MNETAASPGSAHLRARAEIDLAALRANVRSLRSHAPGAAFMAVVKADGYGHGALPCARAAVEAGATWLGAATPHEALALRTPEARIPAGVRVMCWLWTPGGPWREAIEADIDVSVSALWALEEVTAAARLAGRPARVHLKTDTGLGRGGCQPADWADLVAAALRAEADGLLQVVGVWSHLACADEPGHPATAAQLTRFREMIAAAEAQGVRPEVRHIANSPAVLTVPEAHFDLVRAGVSVYGIAPSPALGTPADFGLRPAMTLSASLALVKHAPGGHGVGYGHRYVTPGPTTLGLVPVGYADGVPRQASGAGPVLVDGKLRTVAGGIAMDQFVVDLGGDEPRAGAEVVLFGPGDRGEPTAQDWAQAAGTIAYEIVTRVGSRVPRVLVNETPEGPGGRDGAPERDGAAAAGAGAGASGTP
ncbi:alanine racemase [Streptomyces sp. SID8111]|uniref:alanine racemase n=1 Tax=Streptomyces sp. SID8111 TaxID=2706100 RepID=UPI0013BF4DB1|nr:alanine racemase [Streptomyces sp. SID8111]NEC25099.1 alanine racemase [Streptomyces sp. SID8111]